MRETWRWFGPADPITLPEVRQTGAVGIVSALHHVPTGTAWTEAEVARRKAEIEAAGLSWDVIESLPVSEEIKLGTPQAADHIAAWIDSLHAIHAAGGPSVICYNFMPVLDWTRTVLRAPQPDGGTAMRFDLVAFAAFDLFLLARPGAEADYDAALIDAARQHFAGLSEATRAQLAANITAGLPGAAESWTVADVRAALARYAGLSAEDLRQNLITFLQAVTPVAEELGLRLCCHPDDPPFPLLGLPRVMSRLADYQQVLDAVPLRANGVTFCTGSLGVNADFDPVAFIAACGPRIHFVHLRNTLRDGVAAPPRASFVESPHLSGDTDMVATIRALLAEEAARRDAGRPDADIPMRPDHGHDLLDDLTRQGQPGYPLIGRLRGLAELRGVMAGLSG